MALTDKLTAIADGFRLSRETDKKFTLEEMAVLAAEKASSVPDGTDVTFGNVKKIVVTPAPDNKAYYNGVLLPRIPEDVLAQYPYAWIRNDGANGNYNLVFGKQPWYFDPQPALICGDNSSLPYYSIPISSYSTATEWTNQKDGGGTNFGLASNRTVLWSNHDIPNGSATATDIYFVGSEPVTEIESSTLVPVEREETYAISSESLNALGAVTQKMAGKKALMTVADMVYWLNRVAFIPQGNAENTSSVSQISSAVGIVPTVYRGTAISTQSVVNFSNAVGSIVESA